MAVCALEGFWFPLTVEIAGLTETANLTAASIDRSLAGELAKIADTGHGYFPNDSLRDRKHYYDSTARVETVQANRPHRLVPCRCSSSQLLRSPQRREFLA
jgi:hypothetical protein